MMIRLQKPPYILVEKFKLWQSEFAELTPLQKKGGVNPEIILEHVDTVLDINKANAWVNKDSLNRSWSRIEG